MAEEEQAENELPEIDPSNLDTFTEGSGEVVEVKPDEESAAPPAEQVVTMVEDAPVGEQGKSKIRMDSAGLGVHEKAAFRRALNITGTGATRCKMFYAKIGPAPMDYMQKSINDWLDQEELEVKFVSQVVGVMEGKRSEPNLIITIWY
jgi:hypothetical protein